MENTFTLTVTETGNKAAKFIYSIINDQTGEVVTTRKSNRVYVAATQHGTFFFGRMDLIGKGDHGRLVRNHQNALASGNCRDIESYKSDLASWTTIATIK